MAEVKVLVKGYTSEDKDEEVTCATISLVRDGDIIMVVDPGVLENQKILVDSLKKEGLRIEDVTHVCITHSHIDHYRNIGMFKDAKTLEYYGLWDGNKVDDWGEDFSKNIKILNTPGHDKTGITLLVKTDLGVIAVCGDVFWKKDFPKKDIYADDIDFLKKSRKKVLELADYIVPGHDDMYKV
ncbi:MBL fold metallo-hydrolase [Candidatus Pacearchaeota archaeon]|nr:MBL fold metallo-hydrolase [Candidatus Pacearchaeota archaeon]